MNFSKKIKKFFIPLSILFTLCGIVVIWVHNNSSTGQYLFLAGVIGLAFSVAQPFLYRESVLQTWALKNSLTYFSGGKRQEILDRLDDSPGKSFCNARKLMSSRSSSPAEISFKDAFKQVWTRTKPYIISGPYVTGSINSRKIHIYPLCGELFNDSTFSPFRFYGWCMELSSIPIAATVSVSKHFLGQKDSMTTEFNAFEKKYHINAPTNAKVLQLLDPNMVSIIMQSEIGIVEFSDKSICLIHTIFPPSFESLDRYLKYGLSIAHQLEHNFPLGKYEKA